ncbi:MAG: preprotein translocase subunit SecG [Bacteriovoracia bacterium]
MLTGLIVFHVIICILLIVVVLLQFGKGAETGAVMGSSASQAIFTSSQTGNIFTKLTTVLAVLFMLNSIALSTLTSREADKSIFDEVPVTTEQKTFPENVAPPAASPSPTPAKEQK